METSDEGTVLKLVLFNIFVSDIVGLNVSSTSLWVIASWVISLYTGEKECHQGLATLTGLRGGLMKFNKAKCKVLHLGWDNLKQEHRLGHWDWVDWEQSFSWGMLRSWLVDEKLNVTQKYTPAAQKARNPSVSLASSKEVSLAHQGKWFSPFALHLWDTSWNTVFSSGDPSTSKSWTCSSMCRGSPWRASPFIPLNKLRELRLFSLEKRGRPPGRLYSGFPVLKGGL